MPEAELTWYAATAANLLDARRKNGRLGSRKSRAGCTTCKIRKVKCDESRPECNKCKSTGRKCGYADSPPRSKKNTSLVGSHLSLSLGLKESERRTFDFFLSWTAPRLAGSLDKVCIFIAIWWSKRDWYLWGLLVWLCSPASASGTFGSQQPFGNIDAIWTSTIPSILPHRRSIERFYDWRSLHDRDIQVSSSGRQPSQCTKVLQQSYTSLQETHGKRKCYSAAGDP